VDHVDIAVDAANGVPLGVQVFARGHAAAVLSSTFTSVSFARPAASRFTFTPPRGATVRQVPLPTANGAGQLPPRVPATPRTGASATKGSPVRTIGTGWATIVEVTPGNGGSGAASLPGLPLPGGTALLNQLTTPVPGGRALRGTLFSVLLTNDGRVLVGAVPVDALTAAAR
jgi:hypothetical protein